MTAKNEKLLPPFNNLIKEIVKLPHNIIPSPSPHSIESKLNRFNRFWNGEDCHCFGSAFMTLTVQMQRQVTAEIDQITADLRCCCTSSGKCKLPWMSYGPSSSTGTRRRLGGWAERGWRFKSSSTIEARLKKNISKKEMVVLPEGLMGIVCVR